MKKFFKNAMVKYGSAIAACAFAVVTVAANSACWAAFYEEEEPVGLEKFKKFNR